MRKLILNSSKIFIFTWNIFGLYWDFLFNSLAFSEAPVKLNFIFFSRNSKSTHYLLQNSFPRFCFNTSYQNFVTFWGSPMTLYCSCMIFWSGIFLNIICTSQFMYFYTCKLFKSPIFFLTSTWGLSFVPRQSWSWRPSSSV